jgi:hypothetical protein
MVFSAPNEDIEKMRPPEGEANSFNADAEVIAGQVVKMTGGGSVSPANTAGETAYGVSTQSVATGDDLTVLGSGARVLFTAAGAVSPGDPLTVDPTTNEGEVAPATTTGDYIVGYAHGSAGAQGDTFVGVVDRGGEVN